MRIVPPYDLRKDIQASVEYLRDRAARLNIPFEPDELVVAALEDEKAGDEEGSRLWAIMRRRVLRETAETPPGAAS